MHARVTHVHIQPGKVEDFTGGLDSIVPMIRQQAGFRAMVVLRNDTGKTPAATVITVWDSLADLKASEKNLFLYQALSRVLSFCEEFPSIREQEVLLGEFAAG
jgi:heme-degrading monooxygenase HmoA